jgi:alpha-glucosidase (family GH31 glycosyl hydrolase)
MHFDAMNIKIFYIMLIMNILRTSKVRNHSSRIMAGALVLCTVFSFNGLSGQQAKQKKPPVIEKDFYRGSVIRVKFMKENMLRISISQKGKAFIESGLNRYGIIRDITDDNMKIRISESGKSFSAGTPRLILKANSSTGEIVITDQSGKNIILHQLSADLSGIPSRVTFRAADDENWTGFGDQSRERIYHRGYIADCYVRNVQSYIPVPFFMSTRGAAVLVNTSYRIKFDMCKSDPRDYFWDDESGSVDYYVMTGSGFRDLIDLYTDLTGKPQLPPEWSFGLWYICRTQANDYEAVNDALNFRREGIPCDVLGLEPGWMEKNYDYSTKKTWSRERFPIPSYAPNGPHNFFNAIKRMGFKMELWLCNDYDLSYEEERRLDNKGAVVSQEVTRGRPADIIEVDGHLVKENVKEQASSKSDQITIKDEPWFEHLKKFVDQGADFFKQDGSNQVVEHKGKIWGNGMTDAELHNLYPLFYSRQMYEGFKAYTNRRPVIFTPAGWTGFQSWSGTWTGDTGGRLATLGAMLNTSIVGHSWSTNDMEVMEKEGIHFGYLQPWSQINSWNYFRMPWVQGQELSAMHKYYAQLRSTLIPYLYSWAYYATKTGWPMLLPLTFEFPGDENCRENLHQYLLGRDLLVGIYDKKIYFPEGKWKDYWSGDIVQGACEKEIDWPGDRGGALYIRQGAIIPFGPLMQFRGEKPVDEITLYIFPAGQESSFDLYEDDGITFRYLDGEYTLTRITAKSQGGSAEINIGSSDGNFKGKVKNRKWNIIIHSDSGPSSVSLNGESIPGTGYSWDYKRKEVTIKSLKAPAVIKVGW